MVGVCHVSFESPQAPEGSCWSARLQGHLKSEGNRNTGGEWHARVSRLRVCASASVMSTAVLRLHNLSRVSRVWPVMRVRQEKCGAPGMCLRMESV